MKEIIDYSKSLDKTTGDKNKNNKRKYSEAFKNEVISYTNKCNNNLLAWKNFKVEVSNLKLCRKELIPPNKFKNFKILKREYI